MGGKAAFLRVGLLLVAGAAAIVGVVLFLTGSQVHNGVHYESYFSESVQGLDVGAPVKFRGVTLGQVAAIALVGAVYPDAIPQEATQRSYRLVVVRYEIDPKRLGGLLATPDAVAQGLRARLAAQGLTGLAYLELDFVDPAKFPAAAVPWIPANPVIPSVPSTVTQVQDGVTQVLDRLKAIDYAAFAASTQRVLDDLHTQITTGEVHAVLSDTAAITATLRRTLDEAQLDQVAADLRAGAAGFRGLAQGGQAQELLSSAARAADRLAEAAKQLPPLLAALQAGTRRANDSLSDVTAALVPVLRDARAAAANLRDTSETLRRYPAGALLGGPPPREPAP